MEAGHIGGSILDGGDGRKETFFGKIADPFDTCHILNL